MLTDEQGVKAIIELQALVGVKEPHEKAEASWALMSEEHRKQTEYIHKVVVEAYEELAR